MKSNLIAWQPFWRARRALEVLRAKCTAAIPCAPEDWQELEIAIADLGQLAICAEEIGVLEQPKKAAAR
jgi:hypothetical protein